MREIWIPLALISLFLFLYIIRPCLKKLRVIDGLAWLPLLALISTLVLIPAYGFRPETVPLLFYSAVLTLIVIFKQMNGDIKFRSFRKGRLIFVFFPLILLFVTCIVAFYFTPQKSLSPSADAVYSLNIDGSSISIYTDENDSMPQRRPLLVLLPPELGSMRVIDETARELRDRGFTVFVFARNSGINPAAGFRSVYAFFSGHASARANKHGRALEEKRKEDVLFILSWIRQNPGLGENIRLFDIASRDAVYLAGYDAGGSALILLSDSLSRAGGITIRGLIAVECPLWSLYAEEVNQISEIPSDAGWFRTVKYGIQRWLTDIKPKKITGLVTGLPSHVSRIPEISIPILFLVSDWSRHHVPGTRPGRYDALFKCFGSAKDQAFLVSADGANPLDYSDFPVCYPLVTAILNGELRESLTWKADEAPARTAAIITNFSESVFNAREGEICVFKATGYLKGIQIEAK